METEAPDYYDLRNDCKVNIRLPGALRDRIRARARLVRRDVSEWCRIVLVREIEKIDRSSDK